MGHCQDSSLYEYPSKLLRQHLIIHMQEQEMKV